jgi:hypothetical protein
MAAGWLDVLRALARRHGPANTHELALVLHSIPQVVRNVLERCRTYGTVRLAGKNGRFVLYEITDVGREKLAWKDKK